MDAHRVNQAREYFLKKNEGKPCQDWEGVTNFSGDFGVMGLIRAGFDPTEQFVGSYDINIEYDPATSTPTYVLTNTTSFKSLMYGIAPDWNRSTFGPGGKRIRYVLVAWLQDAMAPRSSQPTN